MKKVIVLSLFLASIFSACQPTSKETRGQVFRVNIGSNPSTLDPSKARDTLSLNLIRLLFEGLTRLDGGENPQLALASHLEISEDMKTYTFKLKKTSWTNGHPLTAHDFVYSWRRALDPHSAADYAPALFLLKNGKAVREGKLPIEALGVKALDSLTLQVELERPTSKFVEHLSFPTFFPINEKMDRSNSHWSEKEKTFVSNGPFSLLAWTPENQMILKKNRTFWDAQGVKLDQVIMTMVDAETEFQMYQKGELDWAGSPLTSLPPDALQELKAQGVVKSKPFAGTQFLRVNTTLPILQDKNFRKAVALAINRSEITNQALQGGQTPAFGLVPAKMALQEAPYFEDGDLEKAQFLLKSSAYEEGKAVHLLYCRSNRNHIVAQVLQEQLRKGLRVHIQLEAVEKKVYFSRISKKDFELALCNWVADFNDPLDFLEFLKDKERGTNNTGWENPAYTRMLDRSLEMIDSKERYALLAEAERMMLEEAPIIPLYDLNMQFMHRDKVKNVHISSMGNMELRWASIVE